MKGARAKSELRVWVVEDHPVLRDVLVEFIERLPQVAQCMASDSAEAALASIGRSVPDLMLIDLSLPGMSGIDLVRELRKVHPDLRCVILSGHRSGGYVNNALAAGANGYLLKGDPLEVERGIEAILAGQQYVSRGLDGA
jgi:DNA-binding NarL/FixJ family response regulator